MATWGLSKGSGRRSPNRRTERARSAGSTGSGEHRPGDRLDGTLPDPALFAVLPGGADGTIAAN